ncbi:hypothetical protein MNBD_GAMMA11-1375 [hydrothermal vent metagenome]|uniref:HTH lysR-type domain-containing protein n=1 Tax=hydrothermal vent metagenome TaxID=652676 RepID=A0A3B0XMI7_9ZZZZ
MNITLQQINTLDAVIKQGSIQAGARRLNKTHPSVITALKKLENELGFTLFDRSGYRSTLTQQGEAFYRSSQRILSDIAELKTQVQHLNNHEEAEINIGIGDITPIPEALKTLREFSQQNRFTNLNLLFENLEGAHERLVDGNADLIIHHIDKSDPRFEYRDFCQVQIIPVVSADFLDAHISRHLKYTDLKKYTQCIIRSTANKNTSKNHFVLEHVPQITVGDQYTKKEIIMQGMAWGHMPEYLIKNELKSGQLLSIEGPYIKGQTIDIVISRLHKNRHGVMAERLWQMF